MRLPDNNINTDTCGMLLEKSFGIGNLGLIFDILRTKIYKNPIVAITREISCNARDAHTEVGTPELPIKIFLPNYFSPNFKVQDFGPGITPDRMENIFINYAASTKQKDNTQIGGFGIGSKTPFSYTDNFSIISITDGIRRTYTAYIDESNIGKMAQSGEEKTDEPNGTTIIVPVERHDFRSFEEAVIKATEFWPVRPELIGSENQIEYKNYEFHFEEKFWKLFKATNEGYYSRGFPKSIILIDGIQYELDSHSIDTLDYSKQNEFERGFVLMFNVGELKLAASRDNIHYDEPTQKLLTQRLTEAKAELLQKISAKIQGEPTYVGACKLYKDLERTEFTREMLEGVTWNGHKIKLRIMREDIGAFAKVATYIKNSSSGEIKSTKRSSDLAFLNDNDQALIFRNDKTQTRVAIEVVNWIFNQNPNLKILQIISTPAKPNDSGYLAHVEKDPNYKAVYNTQWFDLLGVQRISSLKIPKSAIKVARQKNSAGITIDKSLTSVYTITVSGSYRHPPFVTHKTTVLRSDPIVYVILNCESKDIIYDGRILSPSDFAIYQKLLAPTTIYAISQKKTKNIGKNWIPLKQMVEAKAKELEQSLPIPEIQKVFEMRPWALSKQMDDLSDIIDKIQKDINDQSLILKYHKRSQEICELCKKYEPLLPILEKANNIHIETNYSRYDSKPKKSGELFDLYIEFNKKYPLLPHIGIPYADRNRSTGGEIGPLILNYIKDIDDKGAATGCPKALIEKETEVVEKKPETKELLSNLNMWQVSDFDIACLSKLGDLS